MAVQSLKRTVVFDNKPLKDVPGMNAQDLRNFYSRIYPELTTATVEEAVAATGVTITFTTAHKGKG